MLPEAKEFSTAHSGLYAPLYARALKDIAEVFLDLKRYQEAHDMATELVALAKAKFGLEDPRTLEARKMYAVTCAVVGRVEEAKANFEDVLTIETRVLGPDHRSTQLTVTDMRNLGFAEPSG